MNHNHWPQALAVIQEVFRGLECVHCEQLFKPGDRVHIEGTVQDTMWVTHETCPKEGEVGGR